MLKDNGPSNIYGISYFASDGFSSIDLTLPCDTTPNMSRSGRPLSAIWGGSQNGPLGYHRISPSATWRSMRWTNLNLNSEAVRYTITDRQLRVDGE